MSIYAHKKNGKITGTFIVDVTVDGERMKARTKTMEEAKRIERQMLRGRWAPEGEADSSVVTLRQLIKHAMLHRKRKKTSERIQGDLEYIEGLLGADQDVNQITSAMLTKLAHDIVADRKCSNASANRLIYSLMGLLTYGREADLVLRSPVFKKLDEGDTKRTRWLTFEEQAQLTEWLRVNKHEVIADCVEALGQTGMRKGELLNLTPEQIKPDQSMITLLDQKDGTGEEGIPIEPELAKRLKGYLEASQMPSGDVLLDYFKKAAEAIGLPVGGRGKTGVVIHTLRHSTATRLIQAGVNPAEVQGYMRHKSWATTQRYVKITGSQKRNALETLIKGGEKRGGDSVYLVSNVPSGASEGVKKHEENQIDGSLSRTRTCDHSINSQS